jgi:hypothetical protein
MPVLGLYAVYSMVNVQCRNTQPYRASDLSEDIHPVTTNLLARREFGAIYEHSGPS